MKQLVLALALVLAPLAAFAQPVPFEKGDVLVVGSVKYDFFNETLQQLRLFNSNGDLKQLLEYNPGTPIVQDVNGNFYALQSGGTIEIEDSQRYAIIGHATINEPNGVTMTVDPSNPFASKLYVLGRSGLLYYINNRARIWVVQLPGIGTPVTTASIDLLADQCTIAYTDGSTGGIRLFNICNFRTFSVVAPDQRYQNVRALAEGGFVASRDGSLDFYDGTGRLILTGFYTTASPINAIAFDVDPAYIWIGAGEVIMKFRIRDQILVASSVAEPSTRFHPLSITVPGETRPTPRSLVAYGRNRGVRH